MTKYHIIGNMTGNSMDAIDLVLTEFDNDKIRDICRSSRPYTKEMQNRMEELRAQVFNKSGAEIEALPDFASLHDDYVRQIAECVDEMLWQNGVDKTDIDAIGFHGKTLDHNPPSKALADGSEPYTLQIGSGQMLADLTGIPVVYDFRSALLMAGFDAAPLAPLHNAHIAMIEGDGCYYNGGNTSNFAVVNNGMAQISADAGPFNEYTDNYIRRHTAELFDKDGQYGQAGNLDKELLQGLFDIGRRYYETPLPKSGDPAYYYKDKVFQYVANKNMAWTDAVHTFEYFAAYIAVQALTLLAQDITIPPQMILFGGGWKNPVVRQSFADLLSGAGYVLPEHRKQFAGLLRRFARPPVIRGSVFGDSMEARLFADMARYKLENRAWDLPETLRAGKSIVCGRIAMPGRGSGPLTDRINLAAKGWQRKTVQK